MLVLGPLYHLSSQEERQQAVQEAARVVKPKGLLFAAAVNRLAYLRDAFRDASHTAAERRVFHRQFLQDGNVTPEIAPPIGNAHLSTVEEFRGLCTAAFDELVLVGVDSFTQVSQGLLPQLSPDDATAWLELVEQVGVTPEGLVMSDHFLFIGRRRTE